jgi:hypothetical protein
MTGAGSSFLYIYGVVDRVPAELGLGLDGAPLRAVSAGPLAAVVAEHAEVPEMDDEAFWQHEAVVERLMEDAVVLPMRFGMTLADDAAVEALLRSREAELVALFDEVRGAVELSVRAELPDVAPTPSRAETAEAPPNGTEYMRERRRLMRDRDRASGAIHESLRALSRRSLLSDGGAGAGFKGAYLVDAGSVDAFAERVGSLGRELDVQVSCTGPWPPYSFVAGEGS